MSKAAPNPEGLLSIADISRHFSLPESTTRYYCKRFSLYIPSVGDGRRKRYRRETLDVISTILKQDRARSTADAEKLLTMCFENPFADTSGIQDVINKTDPMSTLYLGDTHPDLPKLQEQLKTMEAARKQKQMIIRMLGGLSDHEWVVTILKKYAADKDENVQYDAEKALEKTHANAVNKNQMREAYKKRDKE